MSREFVIENCDVLQVHYRRTIAVGFHTLLARPFCTPVDVPLLYVHYSSINDRVRNNTTANYLTF